MSEEIKSFEPNEELTKKVITKIVDIFRVEYAGMREDDLLLNMFSSLTLLRENVLDEMKAKGFEITGIDIK